MQLPPAVGRTRDVCGCIHDCDVAAFKVFHKIPGLCFGHRPSPSSHRRVISTDSAYTDRITAAVKEWNYGHDRPQYDTPYSPGTTEWAVTTVPSRINDGTLEATLFSLENTTSVVPTIHVDGMLHKPDEDSEYLEYEPLGTVGHWHRTLLHTYIKNPWAQYYFMIQDDCIVVSNLEDYVLRNPCPANGYMNLYTAQENEAIVQTASPGWVEAYRTNDRRLPTGTVREGHQKGRGAVALCFPHEAVELLLSSRRFLRWHADAIKGKTCVDGSIVEAMNEIGWTEYVHSPSLVQHIGVVSTMNNPQHQQALTFPGEMFDALSLLERP